MGKAAVERLVNLGSKVVLCDLPTSKGAEVAKTLGENVTFAPVDVSLVRLCYLTVKKIRFHIIYINLR